MNDVYVGLFIVAAYTLFAALWTGWWRWRGAFWVAMPVIGVLLGLALAREVGRPPTPSAALGAADPRPQRARAGPGDPRADRASPACSATWRSASDAGASRPGPRQPDLPADHGRADARRGRRRRSSTRSPGPTTRCGSRSWRRRPSAARRVLRGAGLRAPRQRRSRSGRCAITPLAGRRRCSRGGSRRRVSRPSGSRGRHRVRPAGRAARGPTTRSACSSRRRRRPSGWLRPGWLLGLPVVWMAICLRPDPARGLRRDLHAVGDDREPPAVARLAGRATPGQTLLDLHRPDVRLPQRPARRAPGVVAVVGVAVRPQAGLVLPGRLRRRDDAAIYDAGNLVIWWLGVPALVFVGVHGVPAAQPRAGADRDRLRRPVDPVGAHRPRRVPVPLLHGPAVRDPGARLLRRRAVARAVARGHGCWRGSRRPWRSSAPAAAVAVLAAAVRLRRGRAGQPGLAGLSGGDPGLRPDRSARRRCSASWWSALVLSGARGC